MLNVFLELGSCDRVLPACAVEVLDGQQGLL